MATDISQEPIVQAMDGARAAALPGPARAAFAGTPITIGSLTLRPVCLGDLDLLEGLQNPFVAVAERMLNPNVVVPEATLPQLREVVYLFSLPEKEAEEWIRLFTTRGSSTAAEFRKEAIKGTASLPFDPKRIVESIFTNIRCGFATMVATGQPDAKGAGPGNAPTTASAGASTSAAESRPSATSAPSA